MKLGSRSGLTLVELLVAMTVSALVLVLVSQGLNSISNWSRGLAQSRVQAEKSAALYRFIRERLIRVEPITIQIDDEEQVLFQADKNSIRFVVAENAYPAKPGLYEQSMQIFEDTPGHWQILLSRLPLDRLDWFGTQQMQDPLVLYSGPWQPSFSFWGDDGWQDKWEPSAKMTAQISFALQGWPALQIAMPAKLASITQTETALPEIADES
ncbi:hypothetical protein MNBD_ALPHA06-2219 [hydrothermal vent metagenome]|uniref:General secretion pathway protein J n=1 Tax=hydrothermal vent metagenome TaxID=652676 RepID=A0A3B0RF16_9ZZZZ